jgi:hypothetical protein
VSHSDLTAHRLQLLASGYRIIPTRGKRPLLKGWNTPGYLKQELTDNAKRTAVARVTKWPRLYPHLGSTGIRLEIGTGAVDLDVDHPLADAVMAEIELIAPEVFATAPTRFGGGMHKRALFVRIEDGGEPFVRIASHRYHAPGNAAHDHCVEIFGGQPASTGNCSRHMGVDGPHSYAEDEVTVAAQYRWDPAVPALWQVPVAGLPVLTRAQAGAIADAFDRLATEAGWQRLVAREPSEAGTAVYDIDAATRFDVWHGPDQVTYEELIDLQAGMRDLRVSAGFIDGGSNRTRCWAFWSKRHACVAVYDHAEAVTHYPAELQPEPDVLQAQLKGLQDEQSEPPGAAPPRPADTASIPDKALWLLLSYGYCGRLDTMVELYKPDDDCQIKPSGFQRLYRAWREETVGPRGGRVFTYATGYWEVNPGRVDVEGVRMRPDRPFPTYVENGRTFKNTYLRPQHSGTGDIQPWLSFMAHLLPDHAERDWFYNWLAHKHRHPGVPGVAVIMVATGPEGPVYGAGRGLLRDIISRLLGPQYVKPIDFDVFTGRSAQGTYTDWGAYATLITVNEAKDTPESGRWTERRAVYERLREIVDPRAIERTFQRKGQQAFTGLSFASYLVFSNNRDALQVPEGDRRIAALANGGRMSPEMAAQLQAWMDQPGNIAALAHWLEWRDLRAFDVYLPPETETKTVMQELARNELEEAFNIVRHWIGPRRLFTGAQVRAAVLSELSDVISADMVRQWVTRQIRADASQVGDHRTLPSEGRHKILGWRGVDHSWVGDDVMRAREAVHQTELLLNKDSRWSGQAR